MHTSRRSHKRQAVAGKWILGIDPGKERHTAALLDPQGELVGAPFSFAVSAHGFRGRLPEQVKKRLPTANTDTVVVAVESSCNLWKTIAAFCHEQGYDVLLVSPLSTHHARPLQSHDFSRTDPKNARLIGENAQKGYYDAYQVFDSDLEALHQLSITRHKLLKDMIARARRHSEFELITSVPNIGARLAAGLIAECRGLPPGIHPKQIQKYAGCNLRLSESGQHVGLRRISHIGNARLRTLLYQMAVQTAAPQLLGQFVGIGRVALVAGPAALATGIANNDATHQRGDQIVQPLGLSAFFQGDVNCAAHAAHELDDGRLLRRHNRPRDDASAFLAHRRDRTCLMHVQADILGSPLHESRSVL